MQNSESFSLKEMLRSQPMLFNILREAKIKWLNYFSDLGEVPRRINNFIAGFDKELQADIRRKIANHMWQTADSQTIEFVNRLNKDGYALVKFSDVKVDANDALTFLDSIVNSFRKNEHDQNEIAKLQSGDYGGKALSYHLYKKDINDQIMDPLMALVCHPQMIKIASMYLGYLPLIGFTSLIFTPVHKGGQFGAQLWHRDLHHQRCLKLFFSPINLTQDQGPFEYFHPKLSTLKYYKYFPMSMTDEQLAQQGLPPESANQFLGGRGEVLFVDTTRCLHRGGRTTQKPRYIATSMYCPPNHSFSAKKFRETEHYDFPFKLYKKENEELLSLYSN